MSVRDKKPKRSKASIHIAKLLYFEHLKYMRLNDALLKVTTDSLMLRIAELIGEEYLFAGESYQEAS